MLRRPAVLLLISAGMHLTAHAQETAIRSSDGDSLRYSSDQDWFFESFRSYG